MSGKKSVMFHLYDMLLLYVPSLSRYPLPAYLLTMAWKDGFVWIQWNKKWSHQHVIYHLVPHTPTHHKMIVISKQTRYLVGRPVHDHHKKNICQKYKLSDYCLFQANWHVGNLLSNTFHLQSVHSTSTGHQNPKNNISFALQNMCWDDWKWNLIFFW